MKITIDTDQKQVLLSEKVNMKELLSYLRKLFPKTDLKDIIIVPLYNDSNNIPYSGKMIANYPPITPLPPSTCIDKAEL